MRSYYNPLIHSQQYNKVYSLLRQSQVEVEQNCSPSKGRYPRSPTLQDIGMKTRCLNIMTRKVSVGYKMYKSTSN